MRLVPVRGNPETIVTKLAQVWVFINSDHLSRKPQPETSHSARNGAAFGLTAPILAWYPRELSSPFGRFGRGCRGNFFRRPANSPQDKLAGVISESGSARDCGHTSRRLHFLAGGPLSVQYYTALMDILRQELSHRFHAIWSVDQAPAGQTVTGDPNETPNEISNSSTRP